MTVKKEKCKTVKKINMQIFVFDPIGGKYTFSINQMSQLSTLILRKGAYYYIVNQIFHMQHFIFFMVLGEIMGRPSTQPGDTLNRTLRLHGPKPNTESLEAVRLRSGQMPSQVTCSNHKNIRLITFKQFWKNVTLCSDERNIYITFICSLIRCKKIGHYLQSEKYS